MTRSNKIGIHLVLAMLSIDNILFLQYKIMGLDIVDIGVLLSFLFFLYPKSKYSVQLKCSKYIFVTCMFAVIGVILSLWKGYQLRYILPDVRDFLFMAFVYEIFKRDDIDIHYVLDAIPLWGLVNSIIGLATFGLFSNFYSREIYTPFWISVMSIGCVLFDKSRKPSIFRYGIMAMNTITILLSQTRTYIIPVAMLFVFYGFAAIKERRALQIILVVLVILTCYLFMQKNGYIEMIIKRFTGSFDSESTMWLRFENALNHIRSMSAFDWLVGRGFGERFNVIQYDRTLRESSELEMFAFNQLSEWGILVFVYTYGVYMKTMIQSGMKHKPIRLTVPAVAILVGGFISGLAGMIGSTIIGVLMGMLSNRGTSRPLCSDNRHGGEVYPKTHESI